MESVTVVDADIDHNSLILKDGQRITNAHELLRKPVGELDDENCMIAWSIIDSVEKELFKSRKADLRQSLIDRAVSNGERGSKSTRWDVAGGLVTVQHKRGKVTYDLAALRELCANKNVPTERLIVEEVAYKIQEKAIEELIKAGIFSPEDLKLFTTVGTTVDALTVVKPPVVQALLPK